MNRSLRRQIIASIRKRGVTTWGGVYMDVDEMNSTTVRGAIRQLVTTGDVLEMYEPVIKVTLYGLALPGSKGAVSA